MAADDEKGILEFKVLDGGNEPPNNEQTATIRTLGEDKLSNALEELTIEDTNEEASPAFPDEVLEHVLNFMTAAKERNSVSQVCKAWYRIEQWSRYHVFIGNCYALSPQFLIMRFPRVKAITLKGKPRFADFGLVPPDWGAHLFPWVVTLAEGYPRLEELHLKRMTVSDESLALLAQSFPDFRVLSLTNCEGLSTDGLAVVISQCK